MKKILAFLLIVVMALSVVSCGMPKTPEEAIVSLAEAGCTAKEYESSYLLSTVNIAKGDVISMVSGDDANDHGCIVFFCISEEAAERVSFALGEALKNASTVAIVELALGFKEMLTYEIKTSGSVVAIGYADLVDAL